MQSEMRNETRQDIERRRSGYCAHCPRRQSGAVREIVAKKLPRIVALAARMLGDRDEADDVAQEAFLRIWKIAPKWRSGAARFDTWLHRVTLNLCYDRLRRHRETTMSDEFPEQADLAPLPDERLDTAQANERISRALAKLPARQREALVLQYYQEIAERGSGPANGRERRCARKPARPRAPQSQDRARGSRRAWRRHSEGTPTTPERFRHITEAYGPSPERWPAAERDAALALLDAGDVQVLVALAEARALDGMLDAHAVAAPSPELARRIVDSAPAVPGRAFWRRPRIWFSGVGFVGAGAAGVAAGALLVSLLAPAPADNPSHGWFEQSYSGTAFGGASSDWSDQ